MFLSSTRERDQCFLQTILSSTSNNTSSLFSTTRRTRQLLTNENSHTVFTNFNLFTRHTIHQERKSRASDEILFAHVSQTHAPIICISRERLSICTSMPIWEDLSTHYVQFILLGKVQFDGNRKSPVIHYCLICIFFFIFRILGQRSSCFFLWKLHSYAGRRNGKGHANHMYQWLENAFGVKTFPDLLWHP